MVMRGGVEWMIVGLGVTGVAVAEFMSLPSITQEVIEHNATWAIPLIILLAGYVVGETNRFAGPKPPKH